MRYKYIKPKVFIVKISQKNVLLAGSVNGSISNETTSRAYGRQSRFSDWEDEEEE